MEINFMDIFPPLPPRHFSFNCAGNIRESFPVDVAPWPIDPKAPKIIRHRPYKPFMKSTAKDNAVPQRAGRTSRETAHIVGNDGAQMTAVGPHVFPWSSQELRRAAREADEQRASQEASDFAQKLEDKIFGDFCQNPVASAFAFEAMENGILKKKHCKKKERIRVLEKENEILMAKVRDLTASRDKAQEALSQHIGAKLQREYGPTATFLVMEGKEAHPRMGTIVHAIHSDLGTVLAWHQVDQWFVLNTITGKPQTVSAEFIKWYKKIA